MPAKLSTDGWALPWCAAGMTTEQLSQLTGALAAMGRNPGADWLLAYLKELETREVGGLEGEGCITIWALFTQWGPKRIAAQCMPVCSCLCWSHTSAPAIARRSTISHASTPAAK